MNTTPIKGIIALCGAGAIVGVITQGITSTTPIEIRMHDESALGQAFYNNISNSHIRFPKAFTTFPNVPFSELDIRHAYGARNSDMMGIVVGSGRRTISFDALVKANRTNALNSRTVAKIESEGTTNIAGLQGYVFNGQNTVQNNPMRFRMVLLDAPDSTFFLLMATSRESDWAATVDLFDSSLSTFGLGQPGAAAASPRPAAPSARSPGITSPNNANPASLDKYLADLDQTDPKQLESTLTKISQVPPDEAHRALVIQKALPFLNSTSWEVRVSACEVIKKWADASTETVLIRSLSISHRGVRAAIIYTLIGLKTEAGSCAIADLIDVGPDADLPLSWASELHPATEPALLPHLNSNNQQVRLIILRDFMSEHGTARSLPKIQQMMTSDPDLEVRMSARGAAERISDRAR